MYAFAKRPWWILSHLMVMALLLAMAGAGIWQLQRHNQKQELADQVEERADAPPIEIGLVLDDRTDPAEHEAIALTHVIVEGSWVPSEQVSVRNHSLDGAAGIWVITPVDLGDGTAVAVNRGFVPSGFDVPVSPDGDVRLTGYLRQTQPRGRFGPIDPSDGTLDRLNRVDLERLDQQTGLPLLGAWVQMESSVPPPDDLPIPLPPPTADGGASHFSYAFQWFAFTAIGLIGYPLVLRRIAHGSGRSRAPDWDEPDGPGGPPGGSSPAESTESRTMDQMVRPASGAERWN